jgi:hypothetical protein
MRRIWSRLAADQEGAVLVEFALILVPVLLMSVGLVELGRFAWNREALSDIAIRAARCMAVQSPDCRSGGEYDAAAAEAMILSEARQRWIDVTELEVVLDRDAQCGDLPGYSRVELRYRYRPRFTLPAVAEALGGDLEVSACFPNQD